MDPYVLEVAQRQLLSANAHGKKVSNVGPRSAQDSSIWVNVYPYLSSPVTATGEAVDRLAIVCMFAHFRLLQTCERAGHDGSLEYIDAVLGCALGLFDTTPDVLLSDFDDLPLARKNVVVTSVLHAVSWCAEFIARARIKARGS